jgi:hypothetical protein
MDIILSDITFIGQSLAIILIFSIAILLYIKFTGIIFDTTTFLLVGTLLLLFILLYIEYKDIYPVLFGTLFNMLLAITGSIVLIKLAIFIYQNFINNGWVILLSIILCTFFTLQFLLTAYNQALKSNVILTITIA